MQNTHVKVAEEQSAFSIGTCKQIRVENPTIFLRSVVHVLRRWFRYSDSGISLSLSKKCMGIN